MATAFFNAASTYQHSTGRFRDVSGAFLGFEVMAQMIEEDAAVLVVVFDAAMAEGAHEAVDLIKARTQRGLRASGPRMKHYSDRYAKKKGRKSPNLRVSGDMQDNMTVVNRGATYSRSAGRFRGGDGRFISGQGLTTADVEKAIVFTDQHQEDKARWHHEGTERLPARDWFGLSRLDSKRVDAVITAPLQRLNLPMETVQVRVQLDF